jgi:hypothetical protein
VLRAMEAKGAVPILNVSNMDASFAWFAKWGWGEEGSDAHGGERGPGLKPNTHEKSDASP